MSQAVDEYEDLGLPFTPPTPVQKRVDMRREETERRLLMYLGQIFEQLGGGAVAYTPSYLFPTATEDVSDVAPAEAAGAVVTVFNHGPDPVLVMAGTEPKWTGQDSATRDQGFKVEVGGIYSTQYKVNLPVKVRCRDGETAQLTVELQT